VIAERGKRALPLFTANSRSLQNVFTLGCESGGMKPTYKLIALLLACASISLSQASEDAAANDKTLSPYFYVKATAESSVDPMPLKSTDVDVKIVGVIADVRVTQTYSNAGGVPLEASYIFPG
jgi:hypothetical protein